MYTIIKKSELEQLRGSAKRLKEKEQSRTISIKSVFMKLCHVDVSRSCEHATQTMFGMPSRPCENCLEHRAEDLILEVLAYRKTLLEKNAAAQHTISTQEAQLHEMNDAIVAKDKEIISLQDRIVNLHKALAAYEGRRK